MKALIKRASRGFTPYHFSGVKSDKGFTLIELLVVIAIIGLLASIILVSLNGARIRARDARVHASLNQVRNIAERLFDGRAYPDGAAAGNNGFATPVYTGGVLAAGGAAGCTGDTTRDANLRILDQEVRVQQGEPLTAAGCTDAAAANTGARVGVFIVKNAALTAYAAYTALPSAGTNGWCVDSTGVSRAYTLVAANPAVTACP